MEKFVYGGIHKLRTQNFPKTNISNPLKAHVRMDDPYGNGSTFALTRTQFQRICSLIPIFISGVYLKIANFQGCYLC